MSDCDGPGWHIDATACFSNTIGRICEAFVDHAMRWLWLSFLPTALLYQLSLAAGGDRRCDRRSFGCCRGYYFCGRRDCCRIDCGCRADEIGYRCGGTCFQHGRRSVWGILSGFKPPIRHVGRRLTPWASLL